MNPQYSVVHRYINSNKDIKIYEVNFNDDVL